VQVVDVDGVQLPPGAQADAPASIAVPASPHADGAGEQFNLPWLLQVQENPKPWKQSVQVSLPEQLRLETQPICRPASPVPPVPPTPPLPPLAPSVALASTEPPLPPVALASSEPPLPPEPPPPPPVPVPFGEPALLLHA
jgi:hypothetical protein